MSPVFYHILHVVGVIVLFIGIGSMLGGNRRIGGMLHGIGLIILLIAGFGLIAKLKLPYTSPFIIGKAVIWLALGALPAFAKKMPGTALILLAVALGALAAYMGYTKALPF